MLAGMFVRPKSAKKHIRYVSVPFILADHRDRMGNRVFVVNVNNTHTHTQTLIHVMGSRPEIFPTVFEVVVLTLALG